MADAPKDELSANQKNWDKIEGRATQVGLMQAMDAGIRDVANGIVRVVTLGQHNADDLAGYMAAKTKVGINAEMSGEKQTVAALQAAEHHITERNDATIPGYKRAAGAAVGVAGMWAGMEAGLALGTSAAARVTGKVVSAVASRIPGAKIASFGARLAGKIPGVSKAASVAKGAVGLAVSGAAGQALAAKGERYVPFGSKSEAKQSYVWPEGVHAPFSDGGTQPVLPHVAAAPVVAAKAPSPARIGIEYVSADTINSPMPPAQINSPMPPPLPPVAKAADAPAAAPPVAAAAATAIPAAAAPSEERKGGHHGQHRSAMPSTAAVDSKAAQRIAERKREALKAEESKEMAALNRASLRVAESGDEATLANIRAAKIAEETSAKAQSSVVRTKQYSAAPDAMG